MNSRSKLVRTTFAAFNLHFSYNKDLQHQVMGCIITNLHCQLSEYVFISADEMFTFMCCDSRDGNIELKRNASYGAANPAALEDNDYQYVVHVREDNL